MENKIITPDGGHINSFALPDNCHGAQTLPHTAGMTAKELK